MKWSIFFLAFTSINLSFGQLIFNEKDTISFEEITLSKVKELNYSHIDTINGGINVTFIDGVTETNYWKTIRVFGKGFVFWFDNSDDTDFFEFSYLQIDKPNLVQLKCSNLNIRESVIIEDLFKLGFGYVQQDGKLDAFEKELHWIKIKSINPKRLRSPHLKRKIKQIEIRPIVDDTE